MAYSLSRGSSGPQVTALQKALLDAKSMDETDPNGHSNIDGKFGAITHDAVIRFQKEHALPADGIVGNETAAALGLAPIAAPIEKRPENILQPHQLNRLAEVIDSLIPTGFFDLIDDTVIKSLVYKVDHALARLLPESWVRVLYDLSEGVGKGDLSAFRNRAVKSLNARLDIWFVTEEVEGRIIGFVIDLILEALQLGRTFDEALKRLTPRLAHN